MFPHHIVVQQLSEWCTQDNKSTQMKVVFESDPSMSNGFVFSRLQLVCYRRGRTSNLRNGKQRSLCPAWHIADGRLLLQVSLCLYRFCVCIVFVYNNLVLYHVTLSPYHGASVPQDHLSWISLHPAAAPLSLGPQRHHGKCNKQFWGTEILWLASIFAHLSLPWSIGWVALSFLVCSFVCLFVRPAMVTPD